MVEINFGINCVFVVIELGFCFYFEVWVYSFKERNFINNVKGEEEGGLYIIIYLLIMFCLFNGLYFFIFIIIFFVLV